MHVCLCCAAQFVCAHIVKCWEEFVESAWLKFIFNSMELSLGPFECMGVHTISLEVQS